MTMSETQFLSSDTTQTVRKGLFYLSILTFVAILVVFMGRMLLFPITAWFDPATLGTHFIHDVTFLAMIWIAGLAMVSQLYRAAERVVPMQIALGIAILTVATTAVSGGFEPTLLVFLGPIAIAAITHPARERLIHFDALADGRTNWPLLALAILALVPAAGYAIGELTLQATLNDAHAEIGHYASMATYVLVFVTLAGLAAIGGMGHRIAAYVAGVMAVLLAGASMFEPTVSAIDTTWSILAILWAIGVVVSFVLWGLRNPEGSEGPSAIDDDIASSLEG